MALYILISKYFLSKIATPPEEGQTLVEYAFLVFLIAVFLITLLVVLGEEIVVFYNQIIDALGNI